MSDVTDVWLLAVALKGEDTYWLCEPSNLKPLASDWTTCTCRWLYPVVENVHRFADFSGFDSTDAVYEVEWSGTSKVLRAATLTWNVKGKRQKVGRTTYVFVPAEEVKLLDDAYGKFVKLEAMKRPPPRAPPQAEASPMQQETEGGAHEDKGKASGANSFVSASLSHPGEDEGRRDDAADGTGSSGHVDTGATQSNTHHARETHSDDNATDGVVVVDEHDDSETRVKQEQDVDDGGEGMKAEDCGEVRVKVEGEDDKDDTSSVVAEDAPHRARRPPPPQRRRSPLDGLSHKRKTPHQGTTFYIAPVLSHPEGHHRSNEAFEWPEMFLVHRGSVDFLCPQAINNTYGFRLDRVMHDGFPVFLLFPSEQNNSEVIDRAARGVPVFQKALLSGEGGEGEVRRSVLILTRLSSKKHMPHHRRNVLGTGRRRGARRGSDSDSDSITEEEEEEEEEEEDSEEDDDDDSDDAESEAEEVVEPDDDDKPLFLLHSQPTRRGRRPRAAAEPATASPPPKRARVDPAPPAEEPRPPPRRRGHKSAPPHDEAPLQAVSVNFWTDPQGITPAVSQLASDFPFQSEGADTPQTVVFGDGVCVTYTAATAAKHAGQEKKRSAPKHAHPTASTEDDDLSMLNEHILNAFAQVRKESAQE